MGFWTRPALAIDTPPKVAAGQGQTLLPARASRTASGRVMATLGRSVFGFRYAGLGCCLCWAISSAIAADPDPPPTTTLRADEIERALQVGEGMPDEKARLRGLNYYQNGEYAKAARSFQKAARYADKYAQYRLSLLYWDGLGVARDRSRSYLFAALAAERGSDNLVAIRRLLWAGLEPAERSQVLALGARYFARYGDSSAKPRQLRAMQKLAAANAVRAAGFEPGQQGLWTLSPGRDGKGLDIALPEWPADLGAELPIDPELYWHIKDAELASGLVPGGEPIAGPQGLSATDEATLPEPDFAKRSERG